MRVELKKLHERLGTTAVYVTHDQVEAMTLGDRVVVMKDGWVQQVGDPLELYNAPANRFVAGFIGSPGMNFAAVSFQRDGDALWAVNHGLSVSIPDPIAAGRTGHAGRASTLGSRPEGLHMAGAADDAGHCCDARVDVVGRLGSEILLDVSVGPSTMVASVPPTVRTRIHETLRLALDPERLHFFDAETEAAL